MNDYERATFLRRLAAFLIDTVVVISLANGFFMVWTISELGGLPETSSEFAAVAEAGKFVMPGFLVWAVIAYAVLSFTPVLGRRTAGMRQVGLRVVRDRRVDA